MALSLGNKENRAYFVSSLLNSYSQIFFSTYRPFAILVLIVTFFDIYAGIAGLIAVLTTSSVSFILNFDKPTVSKGLFGFNGLLVGLGLGVYYSFGLHLILILILAAILTLFISVALQGVIGKYHLPYLSIPFLLALWTFIIATRNFDALGISERGIYTINELYKLGGNPLVKLHELFNTIQFPEVLSTYFISLSAILFQFSIFTGIVLAIGLLLYSRIAFSLSLIGFFVAYLFYQLIGANISQIDYSYIGFNYILTAIALGGFFLIPSARSYLWVVLLIPLVAIITISLNSVLIIFKLPIYSLPFNIVVLLFIYVLKFRTEYSYSLTEVYFQHNWPEKNLYIFLNNKERFRYKQFKQIKLPFYGVWSVSQGHNGEFTHKSEWRHAWDFVILDQDKKQFKASGDYCEDYLCYGKPVIAPEAGTIEKIVTGIDDNIIGEVNLEDNWGNTIIIKHDENLYSKLSHLKKGSIAVTEGDQVKYGQKIAECGNSGRSPYPHLHFQIQENPYIGSATYDYPISTYVIHEGANFSFRGHKRPELNQLVSNIEVHELLKQGFHLTPGEIICFDVQGYKDIKSASWEVKVDPYNETYLECTSTGAFAYFEQSDNLFYFTYFEGRKDCLLYYFFLGCFKVQQGFYQDMVINDKYPLYLAYPKWILSLHDFISPFVRLISSDYEVRYDKIDDYISPSELVLRSSLKNHFLKRELGSISFSIQINRKGIHKLVINDKEKTIELTRCES